MRRTRGVVRFARLTLALVLFLVASPRSARAAAWTTKPAPAWVVPVDASEAPATTAAAENGARYVVLDRQVHVASTIETYVHVAREIANEAGLASSSQVVVDFDPSYESVAVHYVRLRRGGDTLDRFDSDAVKVVQREPNLEAQVFDGRQSLVLFVKDLRVGDVVEYAYTVAGSDPTSEGHYTDFVFLGATEPIGRLFERVLTTGGRRVRDQIHAAAGERDAFAPTMSMTSDGVDRRWDRRNVPAYTVEPFTPSWHVPMPWIELTDFESWSDVAALLSRLLAPAGRPSGALAKWIATTRGEAQSIGDFILRATRFVQDEVRYVGIETGLSRRRPTDPNTVFERRYGDCKDKATLLAAILESAGVAAKPALVSTTRGHVLDQMLPSHGLFDHVILRVGGGMPYWIDATATLQGGGLERLVFSDYERVLTLDGRITRIAPPPRNHATPDIHDTFVVGMPTEKTPTKLVTVRSYWDEGADFMRRELRGKTNEQIAKYFAAVYQSDHPSIQEDGPVEQTDDREKNVLRLTLHFAVPSFWTFDEHQQRWVASVAARLIENGLPRPPTAKRTGPLALPYPAWMATAIDLDLPFDLALTPETIDTHTDEVHAKFTSSITKRRLSYRYEVSSLAQAVEPEHVSAHLEQADRARASLVRSLTYRVPAPDGINWAVLMGLVCAMPLVVFGAWRAYRFEPRSVRAASPPQWIDPRLGGIGGWLVLLAIGVTLGPFVATFNLIRTLRVTLSTASWHALTTPGLTGYAPGIAVACVVESILLACLIAYGIVIALLFYGKRRSFPIHFTALTVAAFVFIVVDDFAVAILKHKDLAFPSDFKLWIRMTFSVLWIGYVHTSARAKATFVNKLPRRRRRRRALASSI